MATNTTTREDQPAKAIEKATEERSVKEVTPPLIVTTPQNPISVDDARYRNRMIAHSIAQKLNAAYMGSYEFKIYQVRKPRSDWGMQDAGIYTYVTVDDVRYTVEFNIRTILEDGATQLEFFVWADTIVTVQKAFQPIINKENMQIKTTGFSVLYDKDYQNLTNEKMGIELETLIKELFASLVEKTNATGTNQDSTQSAIQYCTQCGQPIVSGHSFCGKCGTPVKK